MKTQAEIDLEILRVQREYKSTLILFQSLRFLQIIKSQKARLN